MKKTDHPSNKGGRPAKFDEPSRPVTVTLPLRILNRLAEIDTDRAKAIVKATEAALHSDTDAPSPPVCELPVSENETLLLVADNRFLRHIPWLSLIEIAPGRHLISLQSGVPVEKLEITLGDLLDTSLDASPSERGLLLHLLDSLRTPRRNCAVRSEEILVIRKTQSPPPDAPHFKNRPRG